VNELRHCFATHSSRLAPMCAPPSTSSATARSAVRRATPASRTQSSAGCAVRRSSRRPLVGWRLTLARVRRFGRDALRTVRARRRSGR